MGQAAHPIEAERDAIDDQVGEAIRICGGDARKAVRGLILGQRPIENEISQIVSSGYIRKRLQ